MKLQLLEKIKKKTATVAVIGMGYVGLPLAEAIARKGYRLIGYDIDKKKISNLKKKNIFLGVNLKKLNRIKNFVPTNSLKLLKLADIILICLPTPLKKNKSPDLSHINNFFSKKKYFFNYGQTFILESTTYPGTSVEIIKKHFHDKKFKFGENIFFGYSPERIDPGRQIKITYIPKIVSGFTSNCNKIVKKFYSSIFKTTIQSSNMETAELTKLYENIYRSVNIALVNEMKIICDKLNLNIHNLINLASTKPYGFQTFQPGPGLGGHCVPVDPFYLAWKMKSKNFKTKFIKLAGEINSYMPIWILKKIQMLSKKNSLFKNQKKIIVLGASYKKNVSDVRLSPSIEIINKLNQNNFKVDYMDPMVKTLYPKDGIYKKKNSLKLNYKKLKNYSLVLLLTDHDSFNYTKILKYSKLLMDTRGKFKSIKNDKILFA